jgi:hypothetical protein
MSVNIIKETITWSKSLPSWQQEAVRRLVLNGELDDGDIQELVELAKSTETSTVEPIPIPDPQPQTDSAVSLVSLEHICGVNALVDNQRLEFAAPVGLTVVYGDNGSGKTGYSKVLKHACRSREKKPPLIYGNLFREGENPAPKARFTYQQDGNDYSEEWSIGADTSDELGSIALFDSCCSRAYVEDSGELAFQPYGLGIFKQLAQACDAVRERLSREASSISVPSFASFLQPSVVAAINAVMTQNTEENQAALTTLATLSEEETAAIGTLEAQLAQLKADDPVKQATALRKLATSVDATVLSITNASSTAARQLGAAAGAMALRDSTAKTATEASKLAFGEEPVQGVGAEQWKQLFLAAKEFSTQVVYPDEPFPYLGEDARCVLCHQELDLDARVRMLKFKNFIEDKTAEDARMAALAYQSVRTGIADAAKLVATIDDTLLTLIEARDAELGKSLRAAKEAYAGLSTASATADTEEAWSKLTCPIADTAPLKALAERLRGEATELEKNSTAEEQKKLQEKLDLLKERRDLGKSLESILEAAALKVKKTRLLRAAGVIDTAPITRKLGTLTKQVITQELCDRLNQELAALNAQHLEVEFHSRGGAGSHPHSLRFIKAPKHGDLAGVLSEGEHRCLGIAAFLTELGLEGHSSAIVLDDPVSSLDQRYRDAVALRLAREAKNRQVIILTHDLAFRDALTRAAIEHQTTMEFRAVRRTPDGTGVVSEGTRPEEMTPKHLIRTHIPQVAAEVKALDPFDDERRDKVEHLYDLIRVGWERVVEEVLLRKVVSTYNPTVQTKLLKGVQVEFDDCLAVDTGMGKASRIIGAHRTAAASGTTTLPSNDEIDEDIRKLQDYLDFANKRASKLEQERGAQLTSPPSAS